MEESNFGATTPTFQASWHLAAQVIDMMAGYLRTGGQNFLDGELDKYFWTLVLVKRRIYAFLSKEEQQEIDGVENVIKKLIVSAKTNGYHKFPTFISSLEHYDSLLMLYLRKYGMLVPPKKDKTIMIA